MKLAINLLILIALLGGGASFLAWQGAVRRDRIDATFPPIGQFITINGARVHYKTSGRGPHIVLIHGASGNLREWEFGLRAALESRYTVTAFDRPGHGHSDPITGGAHLAAQAAHLRRAAESLGIGTATLVGHSYGGSVALAWALQSRPKAMVLISAPALPWPGKLDMWYRITNTDLGRALALPLAAATVPTSYVTRATQSVFAPQVPPASYLRDFGALLALRHGNLSATTAQVNALYGDITAQMGGYASLDLPVQLIHGDADTIVPPHIHAQKLVHILPKAQLNLLPGAGHMPQHSHQSDVLAAIDAAARD